MPVIFLSPSLQPFNPYVNGGNEAQYMGYVADALEPYLNENGISYTRSRMPNTLANAINTSNSGNYDLHLALHSNASPEDKKGAYRGILGYYYPTSAKGKLAAQDITESLKSIYPDPELVYTVPSTVITELKRTKAPAVLMEIGYHDNVADADWIKANIQSIARSIAAGLTKYFGLPFKDVCTESTVRLSQTSQVKSYSYVVACTNDGDPVNIRSAGSVNAQRVGQIPMGEKALLLERGGQGWSKVRYNAIEGYSSNEYLCACKSSQKDTVARVDTQGANLNIRSGPSFNASVIGRAPDGATVSVIENAGAWYKISYNGLTGYVLGEFIVI